MIRLFKGAIVGAYNCCFEKPSLFLYKCKSDVKGYFLRKQSWRDIIEDFSEIADILKANVKNEYTTTIKFKVQAEKKNYLQKLCNVAGKSHVLSIIDWKKEGMKQERIENLGLVLKQPESDAVSQITEVQKTFKQLADDEKSDRSIMADHDSEMDYEIIKENKIVLEE